MFDMQEKSMRNDTTPKFSHQLHPAVKLIPGSERSAIPFVNATHARLIHHNEPETQIMWRARDHRKGRHQEYAPSTPKPNRRANGWKRLARMGVIEYWNISWWIAVLFTLGSVVWVVNGFVVYLPLLYTSIEPNTVAGGWTAWLGATIFASASVLLIWEAWNRSNVVSFGWGITQALHHKRLDVENTGKYRDWAEVDNGSSPGDQSGNNTGTDTPSIRRKWIWWTTDTVYWHEIGFLAGFAQLCAATIFWISGFTSIPEIQDAIMNNTPLLNGVYWTPQVIGGSGFVISSTLYMLETQKKWYLPAPMDLGWQIGFWNFIGAMGFTLCGIFGYSQDSWRQYESALSTFWGSWAFLIGSVMQWYEAVNVVHPTVGSSSSGEKS